MNFKNFLIEDYKKQKNIQNLAIKTYNYIFKKYFRAGKFDASFNLKNIMPDVIPYDNRFGDKVEVNLEFINYEGEEAEKQSNKKYKASIFFNDFFGDQQYVFAVITLYVDIYWKTALEEGKFYNYKTFYKETLSSFIHEFNHLYYYVSENIPANKNYWKRSLEQPKDVDEYDNKPLEMIAFLSQFEYTFKTFLNNKLKTIPKLIDEHMVSVEDIKFINQIIKVDDVNSFIRFIKYLNANTNLQSGIRHIFRILDKIDRYKYKSNFLKKLGDIWTNNKDEYMKIIDGFKEIKEELNK